MPKFLLFRDYSPALTRTDIDAMVLAGGAALETYIYRGEAQPSTAPHGIRWVRSYWQPGGSWGACVFEAPSLQVLTTFQDLCATPFSDAMEVEEAEGCDSGATPVALTMPLAPDSDPLRAVEQKAGLPGEVIGRTYWSTQRATVLSLVGEAPLGADGVQVAAGIVEFSPDDYQ